MEKINFLMVIDKKWFDIYAVKILDGLLNGLAFGIIFNGVLLLKMNFRRLLLFSCVGIC